MRMVRTLLVGGLFVVLLAWALLWSLRPARSETEQALFEGVTYQRLVWDEPRPIVIHVVEIDVTAPGIGFQVTPGRYGQGEARQVAARTATDFMREFETQVAINGSFFFPFYSNWPWDFFPQRGDSVSVVGMAMADGQVYAESNGNWPLLCIGEETVSIEPQSCPEDTRHIIAGKPLLLDKGAPTSSDPSPFSTTAYPRTAVAVDRAGQTLWLVVIDGKQPFYSDGATLAELTAIVDSLGADRALNLDGGGSSTLIMGDGDGSGLLSSPAHTRIPLRQRPVANHLGVYAQPLSQN